MARFRGFSVFWNRTSLLSILSMVGFLFILLYLFRASTLQDVSAEVSKGAEVIESRAASPAKSDGSNIDNKEPINLLSQHQSLKIFYNYFINQVKKNIQKQLKSLPLDIPSFQPGYKISPKDIRKVLIVSSFRSGSTFLGELLNSYKGVFYSFEPAHFYMKNVHLESGELVKKSLSLIKDIFTCNLTLQRDYAMYLRKNDYMLKYNINYWQSCSLNPAFCFDPVFLADVCQYMPVNVVKTVRLGLEPVKMLLDEQNLNLKVLHLIRDPRGSLNSRKKMDWCSENSCKDPKTVCDDLLHDLNISKEIYKKYPDRYLLVRYEELSTNTEKIAQSVFKFLKLSFHSSVQTFISSHTSGNSRFNESDPYSTYRNSQKTPFAWRESMSYDVIARIQKHCQKPISSLGFRNFDTEEQYKNLTLSVIKEPYFTK